MLRTTPIGPATEGLLPGGGLPSHQVIQKPLSAVLDVITVISNPARYNSRYSLYRVFEYLVKAAGARLTTVEIAYGDRAFEVTKPNNPRNVQLRTAHELWLKECLVNVGISRLPADWRFVAWVDADVMWARPDWVQETLQQLQHYAVVQMYDQAINLGPNYELLPGVRTSFIKAYLDGRSLGTDEYGKTPHPGYAWAARREAIDALGGLIDTAILGSADLHMARALVGDVERCLPKGISPGYVEVLKLWQDRADRHIRRNIGVVPGLLVHYWHGKRTDRRYNDRWQILVRHAYDPELDLKRDWQGVWQLTDRSPGLRDDLMRYFASRSEDSIDV